MSAKTTELAPAADADVTHPIIVDLGKVRRKRIKDLKRGRGPLLEEVAEALGQVRESMGDAARGRQLVPVVFVYKQKSKRRKGLGLPFGF